MEQGLTMGLATCTSVILAVVVIMLMDQNWLVAIIAFGALVISVLTLVMRIRWQRRPQILEGRQNEAAREMKG